MARITLPRWRVRQPSEPAKINWGHPLTAGLGRYIIFNHATWTDLVKGDAYSGTNPTWESMEVGRAAKFTAASSQFLEVGSVITATLPLTIAARVRSLSTSGVQTVGSVGISDASTLFNRLILYQGKVQIQQQGTEAYLSATPADYPLTRPFDVAGVFDTGTNKAGVYLNGSIATLGTITNANTTNAKTAIGKNYNSGFPEYMDGHIEWIGFWARALNASEVQALSNNPYQILCVHPRRVYFFSTAAGGITVSPDAGQLTLTGYAPTINQTAHQIVSPDKGDLTLTGYAPSISVSSGADVTVTPDAGQLTLTGYAPTINQTAHQIVSPDKGDLTLTGYAPTINQTAHVIVNPATGALVITGYAPTIGQGVTVFPDAGQLTLTGYAPTITVSGNAYINADTGQLVLTGYAPDINVTGQAAATTLGGGAGSARRRRRWLVQKDDETMEFQDLQQALTWLEDKPEVSETPKRGRPRTRKVVKVPQIVLYEDVDVSNLKIGRMTLAKALTRGVNLDELEAKVRAYLDDEEQAAIAAVLY